jgi:hypothetical protein
MRTPSIHGILLFSFTIGQCSILQVGDARLFTLSSVKKPGAECTTVHFLFHKGKTPEYSRVNAMRERWLSQDPGKGFLMPRCKEPDPREGGESAFLP